MLGDIALAEPGAIVGFAGQRVIEETIHETLPDGFQRAEYLLDHGMIDMVVHRRDLRETFIRLLRLLREPTPPAKVVPLPTAKSDTADAKPASADTATGAPVEAAGEGAE
jgi:acetyl-CoA carboxylase carboxyl transferase subunit beta